MFIVILIVLFPLLYFYYIRVKDKVNFKIKELEKLENKTMVKVKKESIIIDYYYFPYFFYVLIAIIIYKLLLFFIR